MLERHAKHTGSAVARRVLENWDEEIKRFVRVMPRDYARVLEKHQEKETGKLAV
jgi:glutamate synthase (NADPH/NADH) large chain